MYIILCNSLVQTEVYNRLIDAEYQRQMLEAAYPNNTYKLYKLKEL